MNINPLPFSVLWILLAMAVMGLVIYRKWVARDEDDSRHLANAEIGLALRQEATGRKLETIDHWGKALTAIASVYGLLLGAAYLYQNWLAAASDLWK
jgi:hypothetical protein